ncbi:MAG: hypothetical protein F6J87_07870, partial [Spirulina sp. SIO3F2]|nr:hypothetical protein [Spirulina sp. SIO3F2]
LKKVTGYRKRLDQITREATEGGLLRPYLLKPRNKSKWPSDHLGPLRKFLRSKVGQPWDEVYSELCQKLDRKTLLGQHVIDHLWDYVERHVELINGIPYGKGEWRTYKPLKAAWRDQFYVHPETGILHVIDKQAYRTQPKPAPKARLTIDDEHEYRLLDGLWFLVTFAEFPPPPIEHVRDAIAGDLIPRRKLYYPSDRQLYAIHKKQCNKKEIRYIKRQLDKR